MNSTSTNRMSKLIYSHLNDDATLSSPLGEEPGPPVLRVLVVEDTAEIIESIVLCLIARWPDMVLIASGSGDEAIELAQNIAFDIVLLDLTLLHLYGLHVLKVIRRFSNVPVIIVTAAGEETTRMKSYEMGATDYLLKPFSYIDLLGSVNAALDPIWRTKPLRDEENKDRGLVIDLMGHRVLRGKLNVHLTTPEWKVLSALLRNHGHIVQPRQLARAGWGMKSIAPVILKMCIQSLRSKIGDDLRRPKLIRAQRKGGYRLLLFH